MRGCPRQEDGGATQMSHRFDDIFDELPKESQELLRNRYGEASPGYWKFLAIIVLAIGLPWLIWSAWYHSNPETRVTLVSFRPIDDRSIEITFDLDRRDSNSPHICTLIVRDYEKNVVGEIELAVPASPTNPTQITTTIPTRLKAVNAGVLECRPN